MAIKMCQDERVAGDEDGAARLLRILWIEDDPLDVELAARELRKGGFEPLIDVVQSRAEFEERLRSNYYDLILADYNLPGWTGLDALEALQAQGRDIPFILVSGVIGEETAVECVKRGAADYVLKDRQLRLAPAVSRALEQHALRQERARAEEALRASERRYRLLFERNQAGVFETSLDGVIRDCNEALARILGYVSPDQLKGQLAERFYADPAERPAVVARLREQGAVTGLELRLRRVDGSPVHVLVSAALVEDERGEPSLLQGTVVDITELKRAQERVLQLNRLYSLLSRLNQVIVRTPERDLLFQEVCRIAIETGGFRTAWFGLIDEATGLVTPAAHAGAEEVGLIFTQGLEQLLQGRPLVINDLAEEDCPPAWREEALRRGYRSCAALPIRVEGRVVGVFGVCAAEPALIDQENVGLLEEIAADVSFALESLERKLQRERAEEARRRTEEERVQLLARAEAARAQARAEARFRELMEAAPDAILLIDTQGRIVLANRATEKLFGYRRDELAGQSVEVLIPARFRERHAGFRNCLTYPLTQSMNAVSDPRALRKDGSEISVEIDLSPFETEEGSLFACIIRDVTERKRLEEQLRQSQKMEALGRLAGGVAHDFNNLLTIIGGYGQMVLDGLRPKDPLRKDLEPIIDAAHRAATLTRQLLTFSRRHPVQPRPLDLNRVVARMDKMLRRVIGEDIRLQVNLKPGLGRIKADPEQVGQVILNLVVNARDAMPDGGLLTIATEEIVLGQDGQDGLDLRPGRYALLAVTDTGIGMAPEVRSRIFEPFFTTKETGKGTGLGLSTVYGIVKQSGGDIQVESEAGRGASFRIYFPIVKEAADGTRRGRDTLHRGTETILLVEDEPELRHLASEMLRRQGYTVMEAGNGVEALEVWETHRDSIDLLLTDVVMPQMSGRELAQRLRRMRPDLPIVYMSGYTDDVIARHGILESDAAFLQKPFSHAELARKIRTVLDGAI